MDEVKVSRLQQESLSFRIQAEEAQRNLAQAHDQLDQIMAETQSQRGTADEKDAELQEEVKGLQQALIDLRVDTARREQQEKDTSEELQQAKALLIRAETELKDRVARAKAYEGHLQSAREEINALYQERTHLKDKLDTAHRELKHAYRLQKLRIEEGGRQMIDITPVDTALQALSRLPVPTNFSVARAWTAADTALCISTIIGCTAALPRVFNRNHRRSKTQPESTISLTKLNPMPEEPRAEGS
ncbi:hypothetical protein HF521_003880 [Silurus meridionalis]|uniref:Uncharacterized protein n=1 Tax=Silurus meridionalis TaxID=175797 RepID=A0A8T0B1L8_SILME|nr:hypothetical protein HF521_003880 [Silurus meridionalis]